MRRSARPRSMWTPVLAVLVLSTALLAAHPAHTQARQSNADMNVTLSVYTEGGTLQGFNDTDPTHIYSIHNLYAKLWAAKFPHVRWKETHLNDMGALETKLALAINAGNPPDMVFVTGGYLGFTVLRRLAQPLDAYFTRYHITASYFLPGLAQWTHFGGHWWAIPAVSGPLAGQQVYVPKYMSALGYNNSNLRTFADYYQMSKKAVRFDAAGNLTRIGYWPGETPYIWQRIGRLMCPVGHGLYNRANQPTATDPCNVAYLSYLKKLVDLYGGYAKLTKFLSGDPDIWSGSPKDYMASGKALITPSANAYWSITPFDTFTFGVKDGLAYQLTPLPPSVHGTLAEAANAPSTEQSIVIPVGAKHPAAAFALSKMISWDYGYLLGPSTNGSPVANDQERWLTAMIAGEAATRKRAGLPGNPAAHLSGLKMQPTLARQSKAWLPINPVEVYYEDQLGKATVRVLYGQQSPQAALEQVQRLVLAQEQRLKAQYGSWNW